MTKIFGHHVSLEMLCLWLLEVAISFFLIYALLVTSLPVAGVAGLHDNPFAAAAVLAVTVGLLSSAIGLYRPEVCLETRRLLLNTIVAGVLAFPVVWVVGSLIGVDVHRVLGHDTLWPVKILIAWILCLFATRLLLRYAIRMGLFVRRVVILGAGPSAARTAEAIQALRQGFFEVAEVVPPEAVERDGFGRLGADALRRDKVWGVIVAADAGSQPALRQGLLGCKASGIRVYEDLEFWERQLRRIDIDRIDARWLLFGEALCDGRVSRAVSRLGDVAISAFLLVFTLPVMLLAALAVKLDSPGPVLYRQERVGLNGRTFILLKFRSMRTDAEARGPAWAAQRDPRVTRVGALIRLVRIDELPQLINVLRGEMSLIGPRPERPHFVEQLSGVVPFYRDRACVKPGLTGWAQVNFPYGSSIEDARMKLSYDLYYVKHRSLFLDILILFSTVRVILFQEGAR